MSSPSDFKDNGDWTVIYDDPNDHDQNGKKEEKPSGRRQSLARSLSIPKTMCIISDDKTEILAVAELLSPKLKLPQLGTDSAERVFPVRSVVSFDSTPSSAFQTPSLDKLETPISPFSDTWGAGFANEQAGYQQKNQSPPEKSMNGKLFELRSFCDILPPLQESNFLGHAQFVLSDDYSVEDSGPEVFFLSGLSPDGSTQGTWCTMHTSTVYKNYVICELQPEGRETNDYSNFENRESQLTASDSRSLDMTSGAFFEHVSPPGKQVETSSRNAPDSSELLNTIPRILQRLANAQTLEALIQHTISTLKTLVQFNRTTVYHFDNDRNGIVVADAVDTSSGLTSYEGMHFLESTFLEGLKKLYTRNTVCSSCSGSEGISKLVYRASTDKRPLDMSKTYLSVAPALSIPNTDNPVKTCLSIQINVFGKLWGLMSCQSYDSSQRLHPLIQKVCWFVAEAVSSNIERLSYTVPFQFREPGISLNKSNTSQAIKTPPGDLLSLFGADYAAASIMDEAKILGKPVDSQEVLVLFEYMKAKENDTVFWSVDIAADFQDLNYSPGFHHLSGLLFVPLSVDGHDFIIFFRADLDSHNLASDSERSSRHHEWSSADFGKASVLSLLYRTFTDIWQKKEATMQNNQLMRLLLANSAHEFRTPLNAIINYLEIVLDASLDQETRDHISKSHSASKSLEEAFDLPETLTEATDIFWEEARQKHVDLQVVQHAALSPVLGDQRRVRQVITNLISNAIQHTSTGAITIESCVVPELLEPGHIWVEVAIHDTGSGMSEETVETLFCELEQVSNNGYMHNPKSYDDNSGGNVFETESVLGLGLALVARIVRNMNGQLRLKSEEGKGSCFKIRLAFPLPGEDSQKQNSYATSNENLQDERKQDTKQDTSSSPCVTNQEEGGIPCECGQKSEFESEEPIMNVDVSLKTGESRNLSISGQQLDQSNQPDKPTASLPIQDPKQSSETSSDSSTTRFPTNQPQTRQRSASPTMDWNLHVLIAEDDPINRSIVQKRLEKFGHTVHMTSNGKECVSAHKANPTRFDAVLMDLQMPIVDGLGAAQMIREYEQQEVANDTIPAPRIPIFAVSASLLEENRTIYMDSGFDGWAMKPIDFQRVDRLLGGVRLEWVREEVVYRPGVWEAGGWFEA
ncbi:CheY-like superfamily [Penicillium fimorum]|uniref:histidine kinase n=1 Tax=Penicillium fimorum TaxID=1882269 RepID=A0A9W9XZU6_9EURO|nr:CheY-like superfamily [Penicillium fimorum]